MGLIRSLRPKQWPKNLLLFAGILFTLDQTHSTAVWLRVIAGFLIFCALSGATYILNDILDVERDRKHPRKRKRPIASGNVSIGSAIAFSVILLAISLPAAYRLGLHFGLLAAAYVILSVSYSIRLKHAIILDLFAISAGFVIRAVAGAVVIGVEISSWLLVCTTLVSFFLALAKRRSELVTLEEGGALHRKTLGQYSIPMIDQMLSISAASTLIAYCLYTFTPISKTGQAHPYMIATIPFVIYGLFRYLFLVHDRNAGGSPELVLIEDKPLLINVALYVLIAAFALTR